MQDDQGSMMSGTTRWRHFPGWLLLAPALFWTHAAMSRIQTAPQPALQPCEIGSPDLPQHLQAKCTSLSVPENRAKPDGKRISLHIAVLPARSSHAEPDALFFLAGGPGQAATEAFVTEAAAFDRIRSHHDIVLVDQRGTGKSNRLDCPESDDTSADAAVIVRTSKACLAQLKGDPRFYTTTVAVRDLDQVRAALGYKLVDLYGISYGTRVALEYLREFPAQVRSVILDGVVPADWNVGSDVSLDAQQALDKIFARCSSQPACHKTFPDLHDEFNMLRRTLTRHVMQVHLRDPDTGEPLTETLTWDKFAGVIRLMSYSSNTAALLPLLIHQAAMGDFQPLMAQVLVFTRSVNAGIAQGMNAAVLCTEDVPFYKQHNDNRQMADSYVGSRPEKALIDACSVWPRGVMEADFKKPVTSDKPVLLLSGQDDPITPPSNAEHAAQTLPNSLSLVVPGQGHGNAMRGCVPRLMAQFVIAASVRNLDSKCVNAIRAFPFFVNFSGPTP